MAQLDLTQVKQLNTYLQQPAPSTRLFVYAMNSETLIPVFQDEDLTEMQANPIKADTSGAFPPMFVFEGDYRVEIVSNQGSTLRNVDIVAVRNTTRVLGSVDQILANSSFSYSSSAGSNRIIPGEILTAADSHFRYLVSDEFDPTSDLETAGGVKLNVIGRNQFTPEAFGASGDDQTNDTAAWNKMIHAAARASETGPVRIWARGSYLLDQIEPVSQFDGASAGTQTLDSLTFDLLGAKLTHTGIGDGILPLEGNSSGRSRFEITGGIFQGHANTKWLIRTRDVRASSFNVEAFLGTSPGFGLLLQNWRAWTENNQIGGDRTFEGRGVGRLLGFQGRKEAWAYELTLMDLPTHGDDYKEELSDDPVSGTEGDYYYNTQSKIIRRFDGAAWVNALAIDDVNTGVGGKSFARTKINNILIASPFDIAEDGLVAHIDGASLYDSEINGIRGNVENNGGSLIYWNGNFALNTIVRNVVCEKANIETNPVSYAFRIGPSFLLATEPPELFNISWTGGYGEPVDPDAGLLYQGQYRKTFVEATPDVPEIVMKSGQLHANTTFEVVLKSNSNLVMGRALVGRKFASGSLRIEDAFAQKATAGPWEKSGVGTSFPITDMDGLRWIAPGYGWITAITLITDAPRADGTCTAAVRHNTGLAGANGASVGLSAVLNTGDASRVVKRQAAGIDGFAPGDEIYAVVTSNSSWAPENVNARALIEVQLDGDLSWQDDNGDLIVTSRATETLRILTKVWKT